MILARDLLVDEALSHKKRQKTIDALNEHKKIPGITYITVVDHDRNLCQILGSKDLENLIDREAKAWVIGLAKGKEQAIGLVTQLVSELYDRYGRVMKSDLLTFFDLDKKEV